jgi:hypothetical protein
MFDKKYGAVLMTAPVFFMINLNRKFQLTNSALDILPIFNVNS